MNPVTIRPIEATDTISDLIAAQPLQPFLQSTIWADFQRALGRRVWQLGAFADGTCQGVATVIEHRLIMGQSYLYCPRGPLANDQETLLALVAAIRDLGNKEKAMYVKIDPGAYRFPFHRTDFPIGSSVGTTLQPVTTQVLDLQPGPEVLLSAMHQKTRYNIRLAEKKGVTVRWSTTADDLEIFLDLITKTYARQGIRLHPPAYYRTMWKFLIAAEMAELGIAELNGEPLAANMVIWHDNTATYQYGGSADQQKQVMAPYVLQWETIKRACARSTMTYDFWGIAPEDAPLHKLAGVTRFKKGFGGRVVNFPPALNMILQPTWYQAYRLAKRMRGGVDL